MSHMDDCTIYRFVRMDLREEDQAVQLGHAVFKMATVLCPGEGCPRMVDLDGGASEKAFAKTLRKLAAAQIPHAVYEDPDHPEWGNTAIATAPLTKEQSLPLATYRLRRYSPPADASSGVALDGQRGANYLRSSEKEHSTFSREAAGSIPAASSNIDAQRLAESPAGQERIDILKVWEDVKGDYPWPETAVLSASQAEHLNNLVLAFAVRLKSANLSEREN